MKLLKWQFVSEEGREGLLNYKYNADDQGISYRFFWNPLCTATVRCIPDWIAPNFITFFGLIWASIPFVTMIIKGYIDYEEPCPAWFCFLQAICFFIYRWMDEMDGKHARATGNGSPLGLLFDHGCDCFALGMQMMIFNYIHGNSLIDQWHLCALVMVSSYSAFHFETLEEYYRGKLVLSPCNGATDGSSISIVWQIMLGIIGPDKMTIKFEVWGHQTCMGFICAYIIIGFCTFFTVVNLTNMIRSKCKPYDTQTEDLNFLAFTFQIAAFMSWAAAWYAVSLVKTTYDYADSEHATYSTRNMLLAWYACIMTNQTWLVQLSHVTHTKFKPLMRSHILIVALLCASAILITGYFKSDSNVVLFLFCSFALTFVLQWHFIVCVINQVATILGIKVFITKQTTERRRVRKQSTERQQLENEQSQQQQPQRARKAYLWYYNYGKQVKPDVRSEIPMCATPATASDSVNASDSPKQNVC